MNTLPNSIGQRVGKGAIQLEGHRLQSGLGRGEIQVSAVDVSMAVFIKTRYPTPLADLNDYNVFLKIYRKLISILRDRLDRCQRINKNRNFEF